MKKNGYLFEYKDNAKDAVFTLEDENGEVIQTITINKDSIGIVENLPVGTFYLKETKTSSDQFVLSNQIIKIVSTKEGVQAFDEKDNELLNDKEDTILFEVKNDLIKGSFELTKKDISTGELLPNTGIQILDEDKNIIVEGRTDEKGVFTFEKLPKGKYFFKEFDAPEGYLLDDSLHEFEIKENGEIVKCEMTNRKRELPEVKVESNKSLPQTGEESSLILLALGVSLVAITGTLYWFKKKRSIG